MIKPYPMDIIFDIGKLRKNRDHALSHMREHDFLFQQAARRLVDNLADIQRNFQDILIIGERGANILIDHLTNDKNIIIYDILDGENEIPSYNENQFDCVIALPYLHTVNDVPGFLSAIKYFLKDDGAFLTAFFGGQSLQELRQAIIMAELQATGGSSPHIHPMIDHYQCAGLLQRAGFALPVVDYERVSVSYKNLQSLYDDLYHMGESNALMNRGQPIEPFKDKVEAIYRREYFIDGAFQATFDIIYGIGWKPHDSQQKPAKRGSGQVSLADILE